MAEAIFKRLLADEIGCEVDDLPERGYTVMSAGVAAMNGGPASAQARQVVRDQRLLAIGALLRDGRGSDADEWFDVDWELTDGRVILPVLGPDLGALSLFSTIGEFNFDVIGIEETAGTGNNGDPGLSG